MNQQLNDMKRKNKKNKIAQESWGKLKIKLNTVIVISIIAKCENCNKKNKIKRNK